MYRTIFLCFLGNQDVVYRLPTCSLMSREFQPSNLNKLSHIPILMFPIYILAERRRLYTLYNRCGRVMADNIANAKFRKNLLI